MILLDAHVVIWLAQSPERISPRATEAIRNAVSAGETLAVPAPAIFEIATEIRKGRVQLRIPSEAYFTELRKRLRVIPVSDVIAQRAGELPSPFHGDPMDRLIVATAMVEDATLVTADARILASGVCKTIW